MKDYTEVFDDLYVIDLAGLPFSHTDTLVAKGYNLHYHFADNNNICLLIGTMYSVDAFVLYYNQYYGRKLSHDDIVPLLSLKRTETEEEEEEDE